MDVFFLLRQNKNELKTSFSHSILHRVDANHHNVAHK